MPGIMKSDDDVISLKSQKYVNISNVSIYHHDIIVVNIQILISRIIRGLIIKISILSM